MAETPSPNDPVAFQECVLCDSIYENQVWIPKEKLKVRVSVYGVLIQDGKILLLRNRSSGKLAFPGGGVEVGEPLNPALRREMREETGLEIEVGKFIIFKEHFFYYDPLDVAFHSFMFFYRCTPVTQSLVADDQVDDLESEKPRWYDLASLDRSQIQRPLQEIYDLIWQSEFF